jgi:YHS domain-containing protein
MCKPVELPKSPINLLIRCDYCHREFSSEVFSKAILGRKRYFCSPVCQEKYEERAKKYIRGELFQHPDEEAKKTEKEA